MNKGTIGVVAMAVLAVVALLCDVDGKIIVSACTAAAGLLGWETKKAKDETGFGRVQTPVPPVVNGDGSLVVATERIKASPPRVKGSTAIDFDSLEQEFRGVIDSRGYPNTWAMVFSLAKTRAAASVVNSYKEVLDWHEWLLVLSRRAFTEAFDVVCPATVEGVEEEADQWVAGKCRRLGDHQRVSRNWVITVINQLAAVRRLQEGGIAWSKIAPKYRTAWGVGSLADNPIVQVGIVSEDR